MSARLFARLKPYNPKLGHVMKGLHISFMGRVMMGGDGLREIPVWHEVTRDQAVQLREFKQNDQNPSSPDAFDIVDEATKQLIDQNEEMARKAALGLIVAPTTIQEHQLRARTIPVVVEAEPPPAHARVTTERPSLVAGAEAFQEQAAAVAASARGESQTSPVVGSGRAAAAVVAAPPAARVAEVEETAADIASDIASDIAEARCEAPAAAPVAPTAVVTPLAAPRRGRPKKTQP